MSNGLDRQIRPVVLWQHAPSMEKLMQRALITDAEKLLGDLRERKLKLALAESCTGGLLAAYLTEVAGSSDVVDRGFVTYSNEAKAELLGVPMSVIADKGAVSAEVARAMADGALSVSRAQICVAVTGVTGPGGGTEKKPVGLVYIAIARTGRPTRAVEFYFGDIGRGGVRKRTVGAAFSLIRDAMD
jgi:nicotinamide-nucleotide amidase